MRALDLCVASVEFRVLPLRMKAVSYTHLDVYKRQVSSINERAAEICSSVVTYSKKNYNISDRKIDRVLTGRVSGYAIMLLMLTAVFWLTIVGANYPSDCLSRLFMSFQGVLSGFFEKIGAPEWLHGIIAVSYTHLHLRYLLIMRYRVKW